MSEIGGLPNNDRSDVGITCFASSDVLRLLN